MNIIPAVLIGKQFDVPEFGFDINESLLMTEECIQNKYGFILWTFIKMGHITDQYFLNYVNDAVKNIEKFKPSTYSEFIVCVNPLTNKNFGCITVGISSIRTPDHEFWLGVWTYIQNPGLFTYRYEDKIYRLMPELKL
jgi:hypothetical protein